MTAVYTVAQGVVVLADRAVTNNAAWQEADRVPYVVWGVWLAAAGVMLLLGDLHADIRFVAAVAALAVTTILTVVFVVNALAYHGAGLSGALSWLLPAALLFETVVFLGRRR